MRVILIEEERFPEVLDQIRLDCLRMKENGYLKEHTGLTDSQIEFAANEMFRSINFTFVRWAQSHGASCVKK
jgi:hypothetical protein